MVAKAQIMNHSSQMEMEEVELLEKEMMNKADRKL